MPIQQYRRRLWAAQTTSLVGGSLLTTTVMIWVAAVMLKDSRWAALSVSLLLTLEALTSALTGPVTGAIVDRHDKRHTMLACDLARAVILAALIVVALLPARLLPVPAAVLLICIGTLSSTVASQAYSTARYILNQDLAPPEHRGRAAGRGQASTAVAYAAGPALAAVLIAAGPPWALTADMILFLGSFAMLRPVHTPPAQPAPAKLSDDSPRSLRREAAAGLRLLGSDPSLRPILIAMMLLMLGGGALEALMLFFVRDSLHAPANWYGLYVAASSVGTLAGAPVAGRLGDRMGYPRVFWAGLIATGVLFETLALQRNMYSGMVVVTLAGFMVAFPSCSMYPLVMGAVSADHQGRALSLVTSAAGIAAMAATAISGVVSSLLGPAFHVDIAGLILHRYDTIYLASGMAILAAGAYAWFALAARAGSLSHAT